MDNQFFIIMIIMVQIIIESLPVSSSAHVYLAKNLLQGICPLLPGHFDELLHGPTIIIVMIFFRRDWLPPVMGLFKRLGGCIRSSRTALDASFFHLLRLGSRIVSLVVVSDLITVIFYYCLKQKAWGDNPYYILVGLMVTTFLLVSLKWVRVRQPGCATIFGYKQALVLGVVQGCALLPGISRFASTYVAGCWLGLEQRRAFQLSFLIQFPLLLAGFFIHGLRGVVHAGGLPWFGFMAGGVVIIASLIAYLLFCLMESLARKKYLWMMSMYMVVPIGLMIYLLQKCT